MIVFDGLHNSYFNSVNFNSFIGIFWILLSVNYKRSADLDDSILNINTKYNRITLSKDSNCFKNTRENCFLSLLYFPLFSYLINVLSEIISQMINDICSKYPNFILLSVFLSIREDFNIED